MQCNIHTMKHNLVIKSTWNIETNPSISKLQKMWWEKKDSLLAELLENVPKKQRYKNQKWLSEYLDLGVGNCVRMVNTLWNLMNVEVAFCKYTRSHSILNWIWMIYWYESRLVHTMERVFSGSSLSHLVRYGICCLWLIQVEIWFK